MTIVLIFIALLMMEACYLGIACRRGLYDRPSLRGSHTATVPTGGGIVFLAGLWICSAVYGLRYPWFMAGATLVGAVSFADDLRPLSYRLRLVVQAVAMVLMTGQLGLLSHGHYVLAAALLTVGVGIVNAYNFMDGINGMTGGYSLAVLLPLLYLNDRYAFIDRQLLYVVTLSVVVFCFFNFRKNARCFAGDVGAVTIAYVLVFAIGLLVLKTHDYSYVGLLGVYGVDTVLTICHRIGLHENISRPHRKHAYQLLANELRVPHTTVAAMYATVQLIISAGLIWLPVNHYLYLGATVALLSAAYLLFMKKYYHLHGGEYNN